eukprot:1000931-Prorocentrum_minimum.AAC.1
MSTPASTKQLGGESNSPGLEWLNKSFVSVSSPSGMVEWLNKGLMAAWSPTDHGPAREDEAGGARVAHLADLRLEQQQPRRGGGARAAQERTRQPPHRPRRGEPPIPMTAR